MHADTEHLIQDLTDPIGCINSEWSMVFSCAMDTMAVVNYASDGAEAGLCSGLNDSGSRDLSFQSSDIEAVSGADERIILSSSSLHKSQQTPT